MKIYIGNLNYNLTEDDIRELFEKYGQVDSVAIIKDKMTGRGKGFGFVEMNDDNSAKQAIDGLNGTEVNQREITVNEARPRKENRY